MVVRVSAQIEGLDGLNHILKDVLPGFRNAVLQEGFDRAGRKMRNVAKASVPVYNRPINKSVYLGYKGKKPRYAQLKIVKLSRDIVNKRPRRVQSGFADIPMQVVKNKDAYWGYWAEYGKKASAISPTSYLGRFGMRKGMRRMGGNMFADEVYKGSRLSWARFERKLSTEYSKISKRNRQRLARS